MFQIGLLVFEKKEGSNLLEILLKNNNGVLISTPRKPSPQKDAFGNMYETHRSRWTKNDLKKFGECCFIADDVSLICYISQNEEFGKDFKKNLISINSPMSRGLIGKKINTTVVICTPGGNVEYKILKIDYI